MHVYEPHRTLPRVAATMLISAAVAVLSIPAAQSTRAARPAAQQVAQPADLYRGQQWTLNALHIPRAWKYSKGNGVTVAVLDTGVDGHQADLTGRVVDGPDFTGHTRKPGSRYWGRHGTSMASIIAGHGHGAGASSGIMGVAPEAKILSVRVTWELNDPDRGESAQVDRSRDAIAKGIRYAADHGAQVISMSLGGGNLFYDGNPLEESAIRYAQSKGVVLVASAGNDGNAANRRNYPAAYPGVIAVGAVDRAFRAARFTNRHPYLSIAAPGVEIVSADSTGHGYILGTGTSSSAAFVAGVSALVKARYPLLTSSEVRQALEVGTTHRPPDGRSTKVGTGVVDAYGALRAAARVNKAQHNGASVKKPPTSAPPQPPARKQGPDLMLIAVLSGGGTLLILSVILGWRQRRRRAAEEEEDFDADAEPLPAAAVRRHARPGELSPWEPRPGGPHPADLPPADAARWQPGPPEPPQPPMPPNGVPGWQEAAPSWEGEPPAWHADPASWQADPPSWQADRSWQNGTPHADAAWHADPPPQHGDPSSWEHADPPSWQAGASYSDTDAPSWDPRATDPPSSSHTDPSPADATPWEPDPLETSQPAPDASPWSRPPADQPSAGGPFDNGHESGWAPGPLDTYEPSTWSPGEANGNGSADRLPSGTRDRYGTDGLDPLSDGPIDSSEDVGTPLADQSWESIRRGFDRLKEDARNWESISVDDVSESEQEPVQGAFDETEALPIVRRDDDET